MCLCITKLVNLKTFEDVYFPMILFDVLDIHK